MKKIFIFILSVFSLYFISPSVFADSNAIENVPESISSSKYSVKITDPKTAQVESLVIDESDITFKSEN